MDKSWYFTKLKERIGFREIGLSVRTYYTQRKGTDLTIYFNLLFLTNSLRALGLNFVFNMTGHKRKLYYVWKFATLFSYVDYRFDKISMHMNSRISYLNFFQLVHVLAIYQDKLVTH